MCLAALKNFPCFFTCSVSMVTATVCSGVSTSPDARLSFGDRGNTIARGEGLLRRRHTGCLRTLVQPALCAPDSGSGPLFSPCLRPGLTGPATLTKKEMLCCAPRPWLRMPGSRSAGTSYPSSHPWPPWPSSAGWPSSPTCSAVERTPTRQVRPATGMWTRLPEQLQQQPAVGRCTAAGRPVHGHDRAGRPEPARGQAWSAGRPEEFGDAGVPTTGRGGQGTGCPPCSAAGWRKPLEGLTNPAGFTETDFHWPPGSPGDGKEDFYRRRPV